MLDFILVGNAARIALPVLQAIHCAGLGRCAVVGGGDTQGLRWSHLCSQYAWTNLLHDDAAVQVINLLVQNNPQAVLIPYDCDAIRFVSRVKGKIRLKSMPFPDLQSLNMLDDKWAFHQFCMANALPVPLTRFVGPKSSLDFNAIKAELGSPFIIKPTNESGSNGVQLVHSREELLQKIVNNVAYDFSPLIAQQYIEGIDMDINLFSVAGQLRAVSVHRPGKRFIDFMPHPKLEEIAEKICRFSHYNGVMNADVRLETKTGDVFLIESNPRFWATLASTVDCGLNFVAESLQQVVPDVVPRRLTSGRSYTQHPFLRPSCWWLLVTDRTEKGRLLRARAFDLYTLGQLLLDIPAMVNRMWRRVTVLRAFVTSKKLQKSG